MAFNFNWSPLTADSSFYSRAQELLTTALNKSPKPPIIVDDIIVNELNLGSVPPELEILEIGDLAEDRFRGIFKMCYSGDAFLTLKTRVQANPLNTYLSTKPSFTSPQPLAAASGLTIPLQITLSDIKLSAFIILVFSRQKGLTLVFRNDPLESLKVSSTFDSIPFVRDYLQKEIEAQLRILLMEEVPAIIHRLSLRLWVPEYRARDDEEASRQAENPEASEKAIDPFSSSLESAENDGQELSGMSSLLLDGGSSDVHSMFSQKNLLRLAALNDSHRTLSLFTPSIRDAVFRAWAGASERGERPGLNTPTTPLTPALTRSSSYQGSMVHSGTFSDSLQNAQGASRPTLVSMHSTPNGIGLGTGRHSRAHGARKRKTRVINLRSRASDVESTGSESGETSSNAASASMEEGLPAQIPEERDDNVVTPPRSPNARVRFRPSHTSTTIGESPPKLRTSTPRKGDYVAAVEESGWPTPSSSAPVERERSFNPEDPLQFGPELRLPQTNASEKRGVRSPSYPNVPINSSNSFHNLLSSLEPPNASILERAWMMKMAGEMFKRVQDEKAANPGFWRTDEAEDPPPPAYAVR
ncbi:MAG: hypothetical protein M4579_004462 [Chaenotheca gracillima]|nr:MAG: hypothetical protein M4579_004462 [Chaenotheca gracillima]